MLGRERSTTLPSPSMRRTIPKTHLRCAMSLSKDPRMTNPRYLCHCVGLLISMLVPGGKSLQLPRAQLSVISRAINSDERGSMGRREATNPAGVLFALSCILTLQSSNSAKSYNRHDKTASQQEGRRKRQHAIAPSKTINHHGFGCAKTAPFHN